jgi:spore photoproduct lyase
LFGNAATDGLDELSARLDAMAAGTHAPPAGAAAPSHRIRTGEFPDSLLLGDRLGLSAALVELFSDRPPFTLELKTKTDKVEPLLSLGHRGRTVISFSVNAPEVCAREESLAAPLLSRLEAAAKAAAKGYRVGLHLDPLIYFPGWEKGYQALASLVSERLDPKSIAWVSMGCLRYPPALKEVMLRTRPSALFDAEFVRGGDGKMRYPRPLRRLMYRTVKSLLAPALGPETIVYLCMESGRIWREVMGRDPGTDGLTAMFQGPLPAAGP